MRTGRRVGKDLEIAWTDKGEYCAHSESACRGKSDINVFYSLFSLKPRYHDWFLLTDTCYVCIFATPWEWSICITGHLSFSNRLSVR